MTEDELAKAKDRVYELNRMAAAIAEERRSLEQLIAVAVAKYSVGQRVVMYKKLYEVSRIGSFGFGSARYFGRRVLKAGGLGKQEFELYGPLAPAQPSQPTDAEVSQ